MGNPALEEQVASLRADKDGLLRMLEEFNSCMKSNSKLKRELKQLRAKIAVREAPSWACVQCGNDNFPKFCSQCGTPCGMPCKHDVPNSTRYKNLTDAGEIATGAVFEEEESYCLSPALDAAQPPRRRRHTVAVDAVGGGL